MPRTAAAQMGVASWIILIILLLLLASRHWRCHLFRLEIGNRH
jgi:hypothetical protein